MIIILCKNISIVYNSQLYLYSVQSNKLLMQYDLQCQQKKWLNYCCSNFYGFNQPTDCLRLYPANCRCIIKYLCSDKQTCQTKKIVQLVLLAFTLLLLIIMLYIGYKSRKKKIPIQYVHQEEQKSSKLELQEELTKKDFTPKQILKVNDLDTLFRRQKQIQPKGTLSESVVYQCYNEELVEEEILGDFSEKSISQPMSSDLKASYINS